MGAWSGERRVDKQRVESGRSFSNQDKIENLYIGKKENRSRGQINVIY